MSHLRPLEALRDRLTAALDPRQIFHAPTWGDPQAMTEALRSVKRDFGRSDGDAPTPDLLRASLLRFVRDQGTTNFTELKYVCSGITVPVGKDQWRVIDQPPLFDGLLKLVNKDATTPKQFRRCYQGLLGGYFKFDRYAKGADAGSANWLRLRGYLDNNLQPMAKVASDRGTTPDWLQTLSDHRNLLTDDPCSRYADGLSNGDSEELKEVCAGLGIEGSSWVWQDAFMAYVRLVCGRKDSTFREGLPGILNFVNGGADLKLPEALAIQATALSVTRYAKCADKQEHASLRDTCVHWIGNPWLKRTAWDSQVNYEPAREMVNSWLIKRLIQDFFEVLAEDGSADRRRLDYWLKWEPKISEMWFFLGRDAQSNPSSEFKDIRARMGSSAKQLVEKPRPENNAVVMKIGPLVVIEFTTKNNAMFIYNAASTLTDMGETNRTTYRLKNLDGALGRYSHVGTWEYSFDRSMDRALRAADQWPASSSPAREGRTEAIRLGATESPSASSHVSPPNRAAVENKDRNFGEAAFLYVQSTCARSGIEMEDNRAKKGALWVLLHDRKQRPGFSALLEQYGFRYTAGKGFWLKEDE